MWNVATSCVLLFKSGKTCNDEPTNLCCTTKDKEIFANVWSLQHNSKSDYLITTNENEKKQLVKQGWSEICSAFPNPTKFCVDTKTIEGRFGPFLIYSVEQNDTLGFYRCLSTKNKHFFSTDVQCEGSKTEFQLGFISKSRGKEMLRGIYRCFEKSSNTYHHSLDLPCDANDREINNPLGFVR